MKFILGALVVFLVLLQYELWFSDGGLKTVWRLKDSISQQEKVNSELVKKNDALVQDIARLKHSKVEVESRARNDLGMVKKNEVFYQVVK